MAKASSATTPTATSTTSRVSTSPDGIITVVEPDERDPNHGILQENLERLRSFRTPVGNGFDIVALPMPKPLAFQGQRVPAGYANFLIINGAVLVPTFRQMQRDAEAGAIISRCSPSREVIPIVLLPPDLGPRHASLHLAAAAGRLAVGTRPCRSGF